MDDTLFCEPLMSLVDKDGEKVVLKIFNKIQLIIQI